MAGKLSRENYQTTNRVYARVGLIGNPSDGFNGKTISLSIKNYWADVTLQQSATLRLVPNSIINDPIEFCSLSDLHYISKTEGYVGELRLLQATCKKFHEYCQQKAIMIENYNFTLSYNTNIPRQVGLAGSSAIITGVFHCLMDLHGLNFDDIPMREQPSFTLSVETEELNIMAGLQDRVIQIYEGLVLMDFTKDVYKCGSGEYTYLKSSLPEIFLVYENNASDSSRIHSNVASRYSMGDQDVINGMKQLADLTDKATGFINNADWENLRDAINENFSLRRSMYGDKILGKNNLRMIEIGKANGAAVKFAGSGGAILGIPGSVTNMDALRECYQSEGFVFVIVLPNN